MNKICTSLEQSKKLMELGIDVNTADIWWAERYEGRVTEDGRYIVAEEPYYYLSLTKPSADNFSQDTIKDVACWSLAALLDVLPTKLHIVLAINDFQGDGKEKYAIGSVEHDKYDCFADNPLDAVVELVIKLHEQKLL